MVVVVGYFLGFSCMGVWVWSMGGSAGGAYDTPLKHGMELWLFEIPHWHRDKWANP